MSEGGRDAYDAGGIEGLMSHKSNVQTALSQPDWGSKLGDNAKNAIFAELARRGYAEGGEVKLASSLGDMSVAGGGIAGVPTQFTQQGPSQEEVQIVTAAILGHIPNPKPVMDAFIARHGPEAFAALRSRILQSVAPGAQTEGHVKGPSKGMNDDVMGTIGGQQDVALSQGEYIVPSDIVSDLGDGNTDAGAQELDAMMERVRMAKHGSPEQPPALDPAQVMPV
jgi:hypothetical protein